MLCLYTYDTDRATVLLVVRGRGSLSIAPIISSTSSKFERRIPCLGAAYGPALSNVCNSVYNHLTFDTFIQTAAAAAAAAAAEYVNHNEQKSGTHPNRMTDRFP